MDSRIFKSLGLYFTAIVCYFLISCSTQDLTGQTVKETRNVGTFTGIDLSISADVYVTQGNQQSVVIEADKGVMDRIVTEISGNLLVIKTKDNFWHNIGTVKVYITMAGIEKLEVSGSGDIISQTAINTSSLSLSVSGSGSIKIPSLASPQVDIDITGSGDIIIAGNNGEGNLKTTITGSGSLKADEFSTANVKVEITGSGSARVNAGKMLETDITGSGDVMYKGKPLVNANSTGSGKTRSME